MAIYERKPFSSKGDETSCIQEGCLITIKKSNKRVKHMKVMLASHWIKPQLYYQLVKQQAKYLTSLVCQTKRLDLAPTLFTMTTYSMCLIQKQTLRGGQQNFANCLQLISQVIALSQNIFCPIIV